MEEENNNSQIMAQTLTGAVARPPISREDLQTLTLRDVVGPKSVPYLMEIAKAVRLRWEGVAIPQTEDDQRRYHNAAIGERFFREVIAHAQKIAEKPVDDVSEMMWRANNQADRHRVEVSLANDNTRISGSRPTAKQQARARRTNGGR